MPGQNPNFEAINLAVIPGTSDVIAWDANGSNQSIQLTSSWPQRYAVGNPETQMFTNGVWNIPAGYGDLFCSAHTYLPDGRLFVAGGNTRYADPQGLNYYEGSRFVGIWDPVSGWNAILWQGLISGTKAMNLKRWYPTVILISDTKVMVIGGVERTDSWYCQAQGANQTAAPDQAMNTYEVFDFSPGVMDWERDPNNNNLPKLYRGPSPGPHPAAGACSRVPGEYPRMHLVSTNQAVMVGMFTNASQVRHDPNYIQTGCASIQNQPNQHCQNWLQNVSIGPFRNYGSSALVPNVGNTTGGRDLVMILGGGYGSDSTGWFVNDTSRILDGGANPLTLGTPETMNFPRMVLNTVLLPDGSILAIGGSLDHYFRVVEQNAIPTPVLDVEIYTKSKGWQIDTPQSSPRMYHSTGALLRSGNVVSAGGDLRTCDWEVYVPPYFTAGQTIPVFAGSWAGSLPITLNWGTELEIEHDPLPVGVSIKSVVLMKPCSVTHHSDFDQRYVELEPVTGVDALMVRTPNAPNFAVGAPVQRGLVTMLPGYYLMFLVTTQGTPSVGRWVRLQ